MRVKQYSGSLVGVLLLSSTAGAQPIPLSRQSDRPLPDAQRDAQPPRLLLGDALFAEYPEIRQAVVQLERREARPARATLVKQRAALPAALRPAIDYLIARCDLALNWHEEADDGLRRAALAMPVLADHVRALRARLAFDREDFALAEALADALPPVEPGTLKLNLDLAHHALSDDRPSDALRALQRAEPSAHWPWEHARLALMHAQASHTLTQDDAALHAALVALWRAWPRAEAGREAHRLLVAARWPAPLTLDELIDTARSQARRKGRGRTLLRLAKADHAAGTKGLEALMVIARQPKDWARRTLRDIEQALTEQPAPRIRDALLDRRARAWRARGNITNTLDTYTHLTKTASTARHRGLAGFNGGMLARKVGRVAGARWLLSRAVIELDPVADARERAAALWSLGWVAWRENDLPSADTAWQQLANEHPAVHDRSRRGYYERVIYWRARVLDAQGKRDEAHALWRYLRDRFPLSYYAVQAHNQLQDGRALVPQTQTSASQAATPPGDIPLALGGAALLWRMGLTGDARDTLRHRFNLGLLSRDGTLLLSAVYRARHDYWKAHWVQQYSDPLDVYPIGAGRNRWLAAYPRPYDRAVRSAAKRHQIDPHLIWAVMRQESGFRVKVRSGAAALGLMQVLYPTALGESQRLRERRPPTRAEAMQIWPNVHYGAAYLSRQLERYQGNVALALAAYNAGPGNVDDWLERFGDLPMDAWVEEIPFGQARGYVRKVLRSYAAYQGLYAAEQVAPWVLPPPAEAKAAREAVKNKKKK